MKTDHSSVLPADWQGIAAVFQALGDPYRQRILLAFEPGERLNVGQICSAFALSRTAVSHHLKVLRQAGVLDSEKRGKEVYFWINRPAISQALNAVLDYLRDHP